MKEKLEESTQIFQRFENTMKKYEIVSDVTVNDLADIRSRLD